MNTINTIFSDPLYSSLVTLAALFATMYLKKRGIYIPGVSEALDFLGHQTPAPTPAPDPIANHPIIKGILDALLKLGAPVTPPAPAPASPPK